MEPIALAIFVAIVLVLALAWFMGRKPKPPPGCEGCRFFSLEGGQTLMRNAPAFAAASEHIPPWMMGQPRKVKPNPEYDALEAEMQAAGRDGKFELQRELHTKLLEMNPGELLPPAAYTEEPMLKLEWASFGACGRHQELRAKSDTCKEREPRK